MPDDVLTRAARMHDDSATVLGGLPTCCPTATASRFLGSDCFGGLSASAARISFRCAPCRPRCSQSVKPPVLPSIGGSYLLILRELKIRLPSCVGWTALLRPRGGDRPPYLSVKRCV
jgi:hypothetical protein